MFLDVITAHRLRMLNVAPDAMKGLDARARADAIYRAFIARVPYENLSNNRAVDQAPDEPDTWPRATDRLLRENAAQGLGGTSFSLAYALRDLMRGASVNAHCTLGYNLVAEQPHAALLVYIEGRPLLYDPAMLLCGPIEVRPGGALEDPLGECLLLPRCGATLTLSLRVIEPLRRNTPQDEVWGSHVDADGYRAVYSIIPVPAPPQNFRHAWLASFYRGRVMPLRFARRDQDVIYRYGERPRSVERLDLTGRSIERLDSHPVERLQEIFGIDAACLHTWFARSKRT